MLSTSPLAILVGLARHHDSRFQHHAAAFCYTEALKWAQRNAQVLIFFFSTASQPDQQDRIADFCSRCNPKGENRRSGAASWLQHRIVSYHIVSYGTKGLCS